MVDETNTGLVDVVYLNEAHASHVLWWQTEPHEYRV